MQDKTQIVSSKLERIDEMLSMLEKTVQDNSVVFSMPKASGLIKRCQDRMMYILSILEEKNVEFWLDKNSLLAACRTGYLLPWETKVYIGMLDTAWTDLCQSDILDETDIVVENAILTLSGNLGLDAVKPEVNVCIWTEIDGRMYGDNLDISKEVIYPLKKMNLSDTAFNAPHDSWGLMQAEFGDDWRKVV